MGKKATSLTTLRVLVCFLDDPAKEHYGLALIEQCGVRGGSLYPILARLEADGWITGSWEDLDERRAGRRKRRYYKLTGLGELEGRRSWSEAEALLQPGRRWAQA